MEEKVLREIIEMTFCAHGRRLGNPFINSEYCLANANIINELILEAKYIIKKNTKVAV